MNAAIKKALKDLEKSGTALTRKNARRRFRTAMNAFAREVNRKHPLLNAATESRGAYCWYCKLPVKTFKALAEHMMKRHRDKFDAHWDGPDSPSGLCIPCVCGKQCKGTRGLARHLSSQEDLSFHLAEAEMVRMTKTF